MKIKLEFAGILLGIVSTTVYLLVLNIPNVPRYIFELFRGGEIVAQTLGIFMMLGLMSIIFFFFNIIFKRTYLWWLRLLLIFIFLFLLGRLSSQM